MRGLIKAMVLFLMACPTEPLPPDASTGDEDAGALDAGRPCEDGGQARNQHGECLVSVGTPGYDCQSNPILVVPPHGGGIVTVTSDPRGFPDLVCHVMTPKSLFFRSTAVAFEVNMGLGGVLRAWVDEPGLQLRTASTCPLPLKCGPADDTDSTFVGPGESFTEYASSRFMWASDSSWPPSGGRPFTIYFRASPHLRDQCAHAREISLDDAGAGTVTGDLANFFDRAYGPVAIFHLPHLSELSDVTIGGQFPDGGWLTSFDRDCVEGGRPVELAIPLFLPRTQGDFYFGLIAPGLQHDFPLPFALEVQTRPAPPPPPDICVNPVALSFGGDGGVQVATVTGDTRGHQSDMGPGCVTSYLRGPAQVFSFTTTSPANIEALVSTPDLGFRPAVALRAGACRVGDAVCDLAILPGAAARVTGNLIPAGQYFVLVGSEGASESPDGGVFQLRVTLTP